MKWRAVSLWAALKDASHRRCTLNRWTWTNLKANDRFSSNNRVTPSTVGDYWLSDSDIVYEPVVDNLSWLWRIIIFVPPISSLSIASLKRKPSNNAISCLRGRAREIVGLSSRKDSFVIATAPVWMTRSVRWKDPQHLSFSLMVLYRYRRRNKPPVAHMHGSKINKCRAETIKSLSDSYERSKEKS